MIQLPAPLEVVLSSVLTNTPHYPLSTLDSPDDAGQIITLQSTLLEHLTAITKLF